jgi:hypothetical protein
MLIYVAVPFFYLFLSVLLITIVLFLIIYSIYLNRKEKKRIRHEQFHKLFYIGDDAQSKEITFSFILRKDEYVVFKLSDLKGEDVEVLLAKNLPRGKHHIKWNSKEVPNGEYFYVLITCYQKISKRLKIKNVA